MMSTPAPAGPRRPIGIPYAWTDPDTGARHCPACGQVIPETYDRHGEQVTRNYAAHYEQAHAPAPPLPSSAGTYLYDAFLPITEVEPGDCLAGGVVVSIRRSKSGKSVWFTMRGRRGVREWPRQSAMVRTFVFSRRNPTGEHDAVLRPAPGSTAGRITYAYQTWGPPVPPVTEADLERP
jgi:hypothetical protein